MWSTAKGVYGVLAGNSLTRRMGIGAGLGGAYGIFADRTSVVGGAAQGAILGGLYAGYRGAGGIGRTGRILRETGPKGAKFGLIEGASRAAERQANSAWGYYKSKFNRAYEGFSGLHW